MSEQMGEEELEELVERYQGFILKTACRYSGRFITKSDDEYSIALIAFHEGLKGYRQDRGALLPYLSMVIRNRLYDYFAKENRHRFETPIDPISFHEVEEGDPMALAVQKKVVELSLTETDYLRLEIQSVGDSLKAYGIAFSDLVSCSPKAGKTKEGCGRCISVVVKNPSLQSAVLRQKQLPLKEIEGITGLPRKNIERHRKYIIAAVVILSGEYPYLSEYLKSLL